MVCTPPAVCRLLLSATNGLAPRVPGVIRSRLGSPEDVEELGRSMRIGIHPALRRQDGGIYQYSVAFLDALERRFGSRESSWSHSFVVFAHDLGDPVLSRLVERTRRSASTNDEPATRTHLRGCSNGREPFGMGDRSESVRNHRFAPAQGTGKKRESAYAGVRGSHPNSPARSQGVGRGGAPCASQRHQPIATDRSPQWAVCPFRPPSAPAPSIDLSRIPDVDAMQEQPDMHDWWVRNGVELMLYPSPHRLSFEARIPFVMAIHDLQHRMHPEFPEVSADGEWERREYVLRNAARTATLLLAESDVGREDILAAYGPIGIEPDRVKVLPYAPDAPISEELAAARRDVARTKLELPDRYLYYPAQFWPHKNHLRLVEALAWVRRERGLTIPLILSGSDSGPLREEVSTTLQETCRELQVDGQVRRLGYVSDEEKIGLYAGATALVMPTFFGPTNLPFLEAWSLGCPVVTSRIRGIVEQVGDAAVTVDPTSVPDMARAIADVWTNAPLRTRLIEAGVRKVREYTAEDFRERLATYVDEAVARVEREGSRFPRLADVRL